MEKSLFLKKIIYFLLACDEKETLGFLYKNNKVLPENKSFPDDFIKRMETSFKKHKKKISLIEKNPLSAWYSFCKNSAYEEVLPVVLCRLLQYSPEKVSWLLRVQPDVLSYRLGQGLLTLGEEQIHFKQADSKEQTFGQGGQKGLSKNSTEEIKKEQALAYCCWLSQQPLPDSVEKIIFLQKRNKIKYWLLGCLCLVCLFLMIWIIFSVLLSPSEIILYQSFS